MCIRDRLAHVHLTDGTGGATDEHLPPGDGDQHAAAVLAAIAATDYRGQVVAEVSTRGLSRDERAATLQRTLTFARKHLGQEAA
jgi:sugar phosphate isomerase/epimerase